MSSPHGKLLPDVTAPNDTGPVKCFGMAFDSDDARRDYFLARLNWQTKDYAIIVTVAQKIPDSILREDPKILMCFDQATVRQSGAKGRKE